MIENKMLKIPTGPPSLSTSDPAPDLTAADWAIVASGGKVGYKRVGGCWVKTVDRPGARPVPSDMDLRLESMRLDREFARLRYEGRNSP